MIKAVFSLLPNILAKLSSSKNQTTIQNRQVKKLYNAELSRMYTIENVASNDPKMNDFLFTLGCFKGQQVTLISHLSGNYVIAVKDARYSIDADLAKAIILV
ncbi:FeoA family protein [Shewanella psychromarinicola]|uniref:Ferrous iron transport protein A n=1 Tax=Shewanella psychromarinicola TaxID=2487742 RepID=A0A3N4EL39_9GAMM|nr:FeoA family protein [Shewanella psychromarinicola]AZG36446.1 ferrous iron transport protein A [Shewanella psychromarinicola]MCL1084430.1 ferrous iron transport protein A [Shewanella psychromarinicola]RPA34291.1 ferrous iron transport protein A [Shewanella psychromarinicola]